jgi:hypothetical protein
LLFILRILNPKKIPSEIFTIPSAVKTKFGLVKTINPMKIPQKPPIRKNIVIMPSLRREGLFISDFDFMILLNIKRSIIKFYKSQK